MYVRLLVAAYLKRCNRKSGVNDELVVCEEFTAAMPFNGVAVSSDTGEVTNMEAEPNTFVM